MYMCIDTHVLAQSHTHSTSSSGLTVKARVWGKEGYKKNIPIVMETPPPPPPQLTQEQPPREHEYAESAETSQDPFQGSTAVSQMDVH